MRKHAFILTLIALIGTSVLADEWKPAGEDAGGVVPRRPSGSPWQALPDMEVPRVGRV